MDLINTIGQLRSVSLIKWLKTVLDSLKGGIHMTEEEEKELQKMLAQMEIQHDTLRKANKEKEYKHLEKTDVIKVYTNDKQAMKFWEE